MDRELLKAKLRKIDTSIKSIESTSSWCKFYKSEYKSVVGVWHNEFRAANVQRKLALLYLCNDIMQKTRAEGNVDYVKEFYDKLPSVIKELAKGGDDKTLGAIRRLLSVWDERKIFGKSGVVRLIQGTGISLETTPVDARAQGGGASPSPKRREEAESEDLMQLRGLVTETQRDSRHIKSFERQNREELSTSVIVSGRANQEVLTEFKRMVFESIQKEKKMMDVLEKWKSKIESSISSKETRIMQIKKEELAELSARRKRKEELRNAFRADDNPSAQDLLKNLSAMSEEQRQELANKVYVAATAQQDAGNSAKRSRTGQN